ncbi:hypothetical protein OWM07_06750 [Deferribacter thermophilus]|uniref:hypothetical protein n=1 Tax=Deferribacter thermophilus TaxID=53573 RepID=UPI003C164FDF
MKKIILFLIIILFSSNLHLFASVYNDNINKSLNQLKSNFNYENIVKLIKEFLEDNGIFDKELAYTLVDIALKNKNKINNQIIHEIAKFYPQDEKIIKNLLSGNYFSLIPYFLDSFSIYTFFYYVSFFFISLTFLYLLIKNYKLFLHNHDEVKFIGLIKLVIFITAYITLIVFKPQFFFQITVFFIILLLSYEQKNTKVFIIVVISIFSLITLIEIKKDNSLRDYYTLSAKPLSYLDKNYKNSVEYYIKSKEILNNFNINNLLNNQKNSKINKINTAILFLKYDNLDNATKLINDFNLINNPVILYNLAVYYVRHFELATYEKIVDELSNFKPYYQYYQELQLLNIQPKYQPYFEFNKISSRYSFSINSKLLVISLIIIVFGIILNLILSKKPYFICKSCGNTFCSNCDEGYFHDYKCDKCRNIDSLESTIDAVELVTHQALIEYNQLKSQRLHLLYKIIFPGLSNLIKGNLFLYFFITIIYSVILYILTFKYELIATQNTIGYQFIFSTIYIVYAVIFFILYLLNILRNN